MCQLVMLCVFEMPEVSLFNKESRVRVWGSIDPERNLDLVVLTCPGVCLLAWTPLWHPRGAASSCYGQWVGALEPSVPAPMHWPLHVVQMDVSYQVQAKLFANGGEI